MTEARLRYTVKTMKNGDIGVYDLIEFCFPVQTDDLRMVGIARVVGNKRDNWFTGKDGLAEASRIVDLLNGVKAGTTVAAVAADDEDSLRDLAAALIADQAVTA